MRIGIFNDDPEKPEIDIIEQEIDVRNLLERIDHKLDALWERAYPGEFLIVVTLEEHWALQYVLRRVHDFYGLRKVHVPVTSFMRMLRPPEFCMYFKGNPIIGSDLVGELSPEIL